METTALTPCVAPQSEPQRRARAPGSRAKAAAAAQLAFLSRLTQDAQDAATPIGAFLAALPQVPKRHAKSSSERGKAFRERQQRREDELEEDVEALKREIIALDVTRKARESLTLNRRTGLTGSLVQTIREYHRLFVHGLLELPSEPSRAGTKRGLVDPAMVYRIKLQEEFIRRIIDPNAIVGNMVGPEASIVQWRRYTQSHATMGAFVTAAEVLVTPDVEGGSDDDIVTVVAQCTLRVRFSRETFKMMFPHVLSNEAFLQRLIGKEITYDAVKRFQFSSEGRIVTESVDVDFVGGLMKAGCSLADISTLMGGAAITPDSMIVEVEEDLQEMVQQHENAGSPGVESQSPLEPFESDFESQDGYDVSRYPPTMLNPTREPPKPNRLSMSFLLSEAETSPSTLDESQPSNQAACGS